VFVVVVVVVRVVGAEKEAVTGGGSERWRLRFRGRVGAAGACWAGRLDGGRAVPFCLLLSLGVRSGVERAELVVVAGELGMYRLDAECWLEFWSKAVAVLDWPKYGASSASGLGPKSKDVISDMGEGRGGSFGLQWLSEREPPDGDIGHICPYEP
jgi:hypothetical protein